MNARRRIAGATAAVAGLGMTLTTAPGYGSTHQGPPVRALGTSVAAGSMIPVGLQARADMGKDAPKWTTYPADFDFTNDTPYTIHVWPESQSGDECWDNPGNPNITLKPGETRGGRAWTQERHLHCYIAFRVALVGTDGDEFYLTPSQPFYQGRADDQKSTMTFYFPDGPRDSAWTWAPWGYWPLPERNSGIDMTKNSALFFRVNTQKNDSGSWDKCRDHNDSAIYCHITFSINPPGSIRPWEFFEKGVTPSVERRDKSLADDPKSWPTIAMIQGDGCRSRGIKEFLCSKTDGPGTDFTKLTVQEKNFTLDTKGVQIVGEVVDSGIWANNTPSAANYTFNRSLSTGEDSSSTSTHSHSVGGSVSFGVKQNVEAVVTAWQKSFSVTINTEHKWEYSDTRTTSKSETKSNSYSIPVPKMSKLEWRILQNAVSSTTSKYTADVIIGPDTDKVQPVSAPLFPNSLISPTKDQPCLAIAIGGEKVPYSLLWLRNWVQIKGGKADPSTVARFMDNAANFTTSGQCPGMPAGYPSRAAFKGEGYVVDKQKGMNAACSYFSPIGKKSGPVDEGPSGGVEPEAVPQEGKNTIDNTPPKCDGPRQGHAVAFDASLSPYDTQNVIEGTEYGDLLMAKGRSGVKLLGGDSRDIIEGGAGAKNVLNGQDGDDIITGGEAGEIIRGGTGGDNLRGGKGNDRMLDLEGDGNYVDGGPGKDRLVGDQGRTTLVGGTGKDVLVARGGVAMQGGKGEDTYVIAKGAKDAQVAEVQTKQSDTVKSWRSFTLPGLVEVLKLQGTGNINGTGSWGDQTIVGNKGNNVLSGGDGFDKVFGGKGKDKIVLSDVGYDKAVGGPGKDRFVLAGEPMSVDTEASTGNPKMAHRIEDFTPGKDKLVLDSKIHGAEVKQLKKVFRVFDPSMQSAGAIKGSGPALVVNTKTGVVQYDHDDRGASPDRVLVRLPQGVTLTAKDVVIR